MKKNEGMFTLYQKDQKLLVHIKSSDLGKDYIVLTSIARGICRGMVLGGMSWGFGDDAIWTFKKVDDKIHVIRRNVRFKAKKGTPEADAVKLAYSDSVLYALKIVSDEHGGHLVDMTSIFMSDDQESARSHRLPLRHRPLHLGRGQGVSEERRIAGRRRLFRVASNFDTVADPRGVQVHVHYSISELPPNNGYKTRVADDRVGYFLTVLKDFSNKDETSTSSATSTAGSWKKPTRKPSCRRRRNRSCSTSRRRSRSSCGRPCGPAFWNGTRPSEARFRRGDRSPAAARRC